MIGEQLGEDADEEDAGQVAVGIETDRGPCVQALIAAGYTVYIAAGYSVYTAQPAAGRPVPGTPRRVRREERRR